MTETNDRDEAGVIRFIATFPPTNTAITKNGQDGMRITLDIDESNVMEALRVIGLCNKQIEVTMREY